MATKASPQTFIGFPPPDLENFSEAFAQANPHYGEARSLAEVLEEEAIPLHTWGVWTFTHDKTGKEFYLENQVNGYLIHLNSIENKSDMLFWLFQMWGKIAYKFGGRGYLDDLMAAFGEIFPLQPFFTPARGKLQPLDGAKAGKNHAAKLHAIGWKPTSDFES